MKYGWSGGRRSRRECAPTKRSARFALLLGPMAGPQLPQDKGGTKTSDVRSQRRKGAERTLTDFKGVRVLVYGSSLRRPDELIVGVNERDKAFHDPYLLNVRTGAIRKLFDNTEKYSSFLVDDDLNIRFVTRATPDGGWQFLRYETASQACEDVGFEAQHHGTGPPHEGWQDHLLMKRAEYGALLAIDLATGNKKWWEKTSADWTAAQRPMRRRVAMA